MKLQTKYIASSLLIVLAVVTASFFLIEHRTNSEFIKFTAEKIKEGKFPPEDKNKNPRPPENLDEIKFAPDSPEARFVKATRSTLWIVGLLGIFLAALVSFILSRLLLRRIVRLQSAMNEYMNHGAVKKVSHANQDELDKLTEVYNLLIEKIDKQEAIRKEFFVDMSHELRTPLTAVKGYLEGLNDGIFTAAKEKDIQLKALQETDRMVNLVKEMTTLAKIEADSQKLPKEKIALAGIAQEVIDLLEEEARKKEMAIEVIGEAEAEINREKFKQIVANLLDNAISHGIPKTKIEIMIETKNSNTHWSIKNKAENISQNDLEKMFERFYRSDKGRAYDNQKPHLGIGLNIVKKLVELHDAKIKASYEDGSVIFEIIF